LTLKELAKLANVSVSTVSRVINKNDTRSASQETRERIWRLVRETNYIPNTAAQELKRGKNTASAKVYSISCIFARTSEGISDPFFSQVFQGIEYEALKQGCNVTGVFSAFEFSQNNTYDDIIQSNPDGIILLGRYPKNLMVKLRSKFKNIVYTGLNRVNDTCDQIICDGYAAAQMAVSKLKSLGHTCIGYIGEMSNEARYKGYYDMLLKLNLPIVKKYIIDTPQSIKGGYDSGLKIIKSESNRPSAIFCANDITAIGVMKALSESNIKIPDDISIISIDNVELCQFVSPMLTSINIPKEDLGRFALKTLLDRIEGGHQMPIKVEIPFKLIQRESCTKYNPSDKKPN
jgi:DNA-binding LacI/PurR family transcriptional regulator